MEICENNGYLQSLYIKNSNVNWVEGSKHFWGECVHPKNFILTTNRKIIDNVLKEEYIFTNITDEIITFEVGELGIWATFNDSYEGSLICKDQKCHAHIWLGGTSSWINAMAMKSEPPHLGLMLTKGSLITYSVERENSSNDRGDILLLSDKQTVKPGESYTVSWDIFVHNNTDFFDILKKYQNFLDVESDYFTFFESENPKVLINGKEILLDNKLGYRTYNVGDAFFRYQVKPDIDSLSQKRCRFIYEKQQETEKGDLEGAYLIYDNEEKCRYFEEWPNPNHNAGRERIAMGLLIARYLQRNYDPELHDSLRKYTRFVIKQYFDEEKGIVYNSLPRDNTRRRIYNNAWYASFFRELYRLEKNKRWLNCMFKAFTDLFENGGITFYPLAMELTDSIKVLEEAGMDKEKDVLLNYFTKNAEYIMSKGTNYPNIEVNFEDNIVIPAGVVLLQMYELTGDKKYLDSGKEHLRMHDMFVGFQPDARMHGASIHHWDDFWFGKRKLFGDTYPHYWSTAGAMLYAFMGRITKDESFIKKARACLRTCLSNFFDDGSATCAIFTPFKSNGKKGDFIDPWANDQDWALYFALVFDDEFTI